MWRFCAWSGGHLDLHLDIISRAIQLALTKWQKDGSHYHWAGKLIRLRPYYCYCWGGDETKMYHMGLALLIVSGFPRVGNRDLDA